MATLDSVRKQVVKARDLGKPLSELRFTEPELMELLADAFPDDNAFQLKQRSSNIVALYGIKVTMEDDNVATE